MNAFVLLDTGPLGQVTHPKADTRVRDWLKALLDAGVAVRVPMIADYELRRELLRAEKPKSVTRLEAFEASLGLVDVSRDALHIACQFWADARKQGQPTASPDALDGDVILAAQAKELALQGWQVLVATTNVGHLSRFVDAREWLEISPTAFQS